LLPCRRETRLGADGVCIVQTVVIHMSISWSLGDRSTATSLQFTTRVLRRNCAILMPHYVCIAAGLLLDGHAVRNCKDSDDCQAGKQIDRALPPIGVLRRVPNQEAPTATAAA
jgi:hypothetical protein